MLPSWQCPWRSINGERPGRLFHHVPPILYMYMIYGVNLCNICSFIFIYLQYWYLHFRYNTRICYTIYIYSMICVYIYVCIKDYKMYFSSSCGRKSSRLRQSRLDSALGLPGRWSWCGAKSGSGSAFATTSRHGLRTDDWGIPIVGHLQIWILMDIEEYVCIYHQQYYMGIILGHVIFTTKFRFLTL